MGKVSFWETFFRCPSCPTLQTPKVFQLCPAASVSTVWSTGHIPGSRRSGLQTQAQGSKPSTSIYWKSKWCIQYIYIYACVCVVYIYSIYIYIRGVGGLFNHLCLLLECGEYSAERFKCSMEPWPSPLWSSGVFPQLPGGDLRLHGLLTVLLPAAIRSPEGDICSCHADRFWVAFDARWVLL